jgi:ATP-binding cassette subfamily F protein 1
LKLVNGRHYGLVGPNGHGKSTLLRMMANGDIKIPPGIDMLYVEQEVVADDTPAVHKVLEASVERTQLIAEEKKLNDLIENGDDSKATQEKLSEVYTNMKFIGTDSMEAKARKILHGLGFTEKDQMKATKDFSGGWRMRISLARALFIEPSFLMLDEPTNHLDLNAVIWLDDYLSKYKKTILVVSHDQGFLNSVCEEMLQLTQCKIHQYRGNYDDYKLMSVQRFAKHEKEWAKQEKRMKEMKGKMSKKQAEEKLKLAAKHDSNAKAAKKKQKKTGGAIDDEAGVGELIERPREYAVELAFKNVTDLSPPIIEVLDVHWRYKMKDGSWGPYLFKDLSFGMDLQSRVCIVGPNGVGKTTLLNIITGELKPEEGEVRTNQRLRVGKYSQHFVDVVSVRSSRSRGAERVVCCRFTE